MQKTLMQLSNSNNHMFGNTSCKIIYTLQMYNFTLQYIQFQWTQTIQKHV